MLAKTHNEQGGLTYSLVTKQFITSGYVVSCWKEREVKISDNILIPSDFRTYVNDNADLLYFNGNCLGTWYDAETNTSYLDVVTVVDSLGIALDLARKHKQIAIWDLTEGKEIRIKDDD